MTSIHLQNVENLHNDVSKTCKIGNIYRSLRDINLYFFFQMAVHFLDSLPGGDFESYQIPHNAEDGSLQGRLLIQVAASGRLEDHFSITFGGGKHPSVSCGKNYLQTTSSRPQMVSLGQLSLRFQASAAGSASLC